MQKYFVLSTLPISFLIGCVIAGCYQQDTVSNLGSSKATGKDIAEVALEEVSNGEAVLLDVRSDGEWKAGHFQQAKHFPMNRVAALKDNPNLLSVDKTVKIYVHCARGVRASKAAKQLQQLGYQAVPLKMTFTQISNAGFAAE